MQPVVIDLLSTTDEVYPCIETTSGVVDLLTDANNVDHMDDSVGEWADNVIVGAGEWKDDMDVEDGKECQAVVDHSNMRR